MHQADAPPPPSPPTSDHFARQRETGRVLVGVERVLAVASAAVGPCTVVGDLSWPLGESLVLEVQASSGERFIAKAHLQRAKHDAERVAYEQWVPALGDGAPRLVGIDDDAKVLIVTKLAAHSLESMTRSIDLADVHRQAGSLLARFHAAAEPVSMPGFGHGRHERLQEWLDRATPGTLSTDEIEFVAGQLEILDELPDPAGVPCHRDWQPRNWMIEDDGTLRAIDFEHARVGPWFEDLMRLRWREWTTAPDLAEAFFDGYGRRMNEDETRAFMAISILGHVTTIVWALEHNDADFADFGRHSLGVARRMVSLPLERWWL